MPNKLSRSVGDALPSLLGPICEVFSSIFLAKSLHWEAALALTPGDVVEVSQTLLLQGIPFTDSSFWHRF